MAKLIYRACMYVWTGSASVYTVIAFHYNLSEAFALAIVCAAAAWFFWWAASRF